MELGELLLETQLSPKELDCLHQSLDQIKAHLTDIKRNKKAPKPLANLTIVFRIIEKEDSTKICKVELFGFPGMAFVLFSPHISKQKYNLCFHCVNAGFDSTDNYFTLSPATRIKPLFFNANNFLGLSTNCTSDTYDRVHNVSFKGFYRNNMVLFDNIKDFNEKSDFGRLQGLIVKAHSAKDCIVLKLLDPRNMIDTMKVYVNFRTMEALDKFKPVLVAGQYVEFETNVKQIISKTMEMVFSVTYNSLTKVTVMPVQDLNLDDKMRVKNLVVGNSNKAALNSTEMVNILPFVFHRGVIKLILKLIKVYFLELKMFCSKCKSGKSKCVCLDPRFDNLNVFCSMLVQNSDIMLYATIKTQQDFYNFFDFSPEEKAFISDYLVKYGDVKYTVGEFVDFSSKKATLLAILEKLSGYKAVFGRFVAKVRSATNQGNGANFFEFLKNKDGIIYPNGSIKPNTMRNSINFVFDFKIKHVEDNVAKVSEERFAYLKSKLLI